MDAVKQAKECLWQKSYQKWRLETHNVLITHPQQQRPYDCDVLSTEE